MDSIETAMKKVVEGNKPAVTSDNGAAPSDTTTPVQNNSAIPPVTPTAKEKETAAKENIQKKLAELKTTHPDKTDADLLKMLNGSVQNKTADYSEIDKLLKTQTKEKYNSIADLIKKYEEKPQSIADLLKEKKVNGSIDDLIKKANTPFASERIKKLNELEEKGVNIQDILKFQSLGHEKLDPAKFDDAKKLIALELKLNEPDITEKEIDYELKNRYSMEDESEDDEEEDKESKREKNDIAKIKLSRHALKAKEKLSAKAKELELPASVNYQQKIDEQIATYKQEWSEKVNQSIKDFDGIETSTGKNKSKYVFSDDDKISIAEVMNKAGIIHDLYQKENGQTDMDKFRRDMTWLIHRDKIVKTLTDQARSEGREEILNEFSNPSFETNGKSSNQSPVNPNQIMAKKLMENGLI